MAIEHWGKREVEVQRAHGKIMSWHVVGERARKEKKMGKRDEHITAADRATDRRNIENYWDEVGTKGLKEARRHRDERITAHDRAIDRRNGKKAKGSSWKER